jgi:ABC-type multidrug transport system ATPase subunit
MALKQPSPEVFELFDDVLLLSEGVCVYHGPTDGVLRFFSDLGFQCPPRMAVPGFLQNITSRMDQQVGVPRLPTSIMWVGNSWCTAQGAVLLHVMRARA